MSLCVIITEMFHFRSQGICYYNKEESTRSFREKLEKRIYIITLCRHLVVKFFLTNGNDCSLRRRQISGAYYINFQLCRADYENLCETSKGFQFSKSQRFLGGNTTESGRTWILQGTSWPTFIKKKNKTKQNKTNKKKKTNIAFSAKWLFRLWKANSL